MNQELKILLVAYVVIFLACLVTAAIIITRLLVDSYRKKKFEQEAKKKWEDADLGNHCDELCQVKFFIRKKDESITNKKMDFCIHIAHYDYDNLQKKNLFWFDIANEGNYSWANENYKKFIKLSTLLFKTIDEFTTYSSGDIILSIPKTTDNKELSKALIKMTSKINKKLNDQNDKNEYIDITDEVLEVLKILKKNKNLNQNIDNEEELKKKSLNTKKNITDYDFFLNQRRMMNEANNDNGISKERQQQIIKAKEAMEERNKKLGLDPNALNLTSTSATDHSKEQSTTA